MHVIGRQNSLLSSFTHDWHQTSLVKGGAKLLNRKLHSHDWTRDHIGIWIASRVPGHSCCHHAAVVCDRDSGGPTQLCHETGPTDFPDFNFRSLKVGPQSLTHAPKSQDYLLSWSLRGSQVIVSSASWYDLCPRKGPGHAQPLSTFLSIEHLPGGEARHGEGLARTPPLRPDCNAAHSTEWMGPGSGSCTLGSHGWGCTQNTKAQVLGSVTLKVRVPYVCPGAPCALSSCGGVEVGGAGCTWGEDVNIGWNLLEMSKVRECLKAW